jgi:hypothetical protein
MGQNTGKNKEENSTALQSKNSPFNFLLGD